MVEVTDTLSTLGIYLNEFERAAQDAAGKKPDWVLPLRKAAMARFVELGFPTRQEEEWRFTNINPIIQTEFRPVGFEYEEQIKHGDYDTDINRMHTLLFPELKAHRIVLLNGRYSSQFEQEQSYPLPDGVIVSNLSTAFESVPELLEPYLAKVAKTDAQAFVALNTAFLEDGVFIHIPRNTIVELPILLVFVAHAPDAPGVCHPRVLVVAGENSQVTVVESYTGVISNAYFTNAVTEIVVGENAVIDHYKLNREAPNAYHLATTQIELSQNAHFVSHSITLGGEIVRNDINADLLGQNAECTLNGLYIGRGRQLIDNHTTIDHAMPHCNSHEMYKGILDDRARGVFNGKIFVRLDAQKTDAKQTNQTLLLSDQAQINTKPQLEIFADDVKCTHGATVGQLSAEAIFYLRSRGIGAAEARALLTYAFAADIVNRIKVEPIRGELDRALLSQLP